MTDFVLAGTRGTWGGRGRLSIRGGWMRGKGENMHSDYIFIYVK